MLKRYSRRLCVKYRKFGKTGWKVSALGFGLMRLPMLPDAKGDEDFDEKESIKIIRYGIDNGINYLDTAYMYHGGLSEVTLGKVLKDGYREKVKIADKLPVHLVKEPSDFDKILKEQMERIDVDHIDFYMFHGIGSSSLGKIKELGLFEKMEAAKADGRIGHIGFSFHDNTEAFKEVVDAYDKWEFCQIQHNYMDTQNQAGTEGYEHAAKKGIPIIIMEPLLGGRLARVPKEVEEVFRSYNKEHTPAFWALNWIWNKPGVVMILSGMSAFEQVEENIKTASESGINILSEEELKLFGVAEEKFRARKSIPCTSCKYCMPCPQGVNIPRNYELYNDAIIYDELGTPQWMYEFQVKESERADKCDQCRECEPKCPQEIKTSEHMEKVHKKLVKKK